MTEYAPAEIQTLAHDLVNIIGGAVFSGIVGDRSHTYGYHRGAAYVPASDYSRQLAGDRNGIDDQAAAALDISMPGEAMQIITARFHSSWLDQSDLRLNYCREVIGTLDGKNVIYMDTQLGTRGTADVSHLWHVHVAFLRCHVHSLKAMAAVLSIVSGESWPAYIARTGDGVKTSGLPYPLRFPPDVFGDIHGPDSSHGGANSWEQPYVRMIQHVAGTTADGIYGPLTIAAVKRYQAAHHLQVDGEVGPQTWHAMFGG